MEKKLNIHSKMKNLLIAMFALLLVMPGVLAASTMDSSIETMVWIGNVPVAEGTSTDFEYGITPGEDLDIDVWFMVDEVEESEEETDEAVDEEETADDEVVEEDAEEE
ncbi:hypothetical protein ACFLZZ_01350, partial [Nanoarchaeota archaeon]